MTTYAVGDVQGCLQPLLCLLEKVNFDARQDQLWLAGDIVNRGPQSLETLEYIYSIRKSVKMVLGNHDLHLLAIAHGAKSPGRNDTLHDILEAPDRDKLLAWLIKQPLIYTDEDLGYTMVHAGIPPMWKLKKAHALANEVTSVLRGPKAAGFFQQMYGNIPDIWTEDLVGGDRLRLITNYLTRMRFCTAEGQLDLEDKNNKQSSRSDFKPWFSHPNRASKKDHIIFGHWAALNGEADTKRIYALDTGCAWGNKLTMLRLEDRKLFQCDCQA
ncbi:MAG: symmetrical bis(5'-nucleosyl)-tetraphosphatase [Pseudomonadales bacterium]